jgi:hypothetical protein
MQPQAPENRPKIRVVMLSCRVPESLRQRLKLAAVQLRLSMADLVHQSIEARLSSLGSERNRA